MSASASSTPEPHGLEVLRTYGDGFAGRQEELDALDRAWNEGAVRVFLLHAEGGAGKTRVVAQWLNQMRDDGYRNAGRVFVHSFYSQGSDERRNASSELFFEQALEYFGYTGPRLIDPTEQGRTLARLIREQRGLLVLDGIEALQHPPSFDQGRLKDPGIHSLLLSLANGRIADLLTAGGLCVVTSRQAVVELQDKTGRTVVQEQLDRLDPAAGAELLRQLEVCGPDQELYQAVQDSLGHAYSLMLLGTYLRDATDDHEIRRRREIPLLDEDSEHRYHARHMFAAYIKHLGAKSPEVAVLRLLGFFDRPAEETLVTVLREATEPELDVLTKPFRNLALSDWRRVLRRLTGLRLIDVPVSPSPLIDSHPLLREYFAEQLRMQFTEAWQIGHRRLFKHLYDTTEYQPATLAGLQPLYQAVAHGCWTGLYEEARVNVLLNRIFRGEGSDGFYSMRKLGAIGADLGTIACFFKMPWTIPAQDLSPSAQSWLLNQAAFYLRALGRLAEAIESVRIGLRSEIERKEWESAALSASDLSELELTKGKLPAALKAGEQALGYADRSSNKHWQMVSRTTLADALHQAGQLEESRRLFEEAEHWQAKRQPELTRLYALGGFWYSDLLLYEAECAAWRQFLLAPSAYSVKSSLDERSAAEESGINENLPRIIDACDEATRRATYALEIANRHQWLLHIALDHLTIARAALYKAHFVLPILCPEDGYAAAAVSDLRAAGQMYFIPRGLLTRAWIRFRSNDETGCREDLDEAWEIAERGPMPLFQADIQLYRARLFRDRAALAEARRLIEKHGYHRRDEELADAEAAAQEWPEAPNSAQLSDSLQAKADLVSSEESMQDQVFISYSHRDKKLMEEFLTHLKPYLRSGSVSAWSDQQVAAGLKWFEEIKNALGRGSVAVLLVSPDFLASDFIHEHELGPLLKEAGSGGVKILWVPIRASAYEETPLRHYQAVSSPDEPLGAKSKAERDKAWVRICKEVRKAVNP